ncbi:ThuA domain-containing protein [Amycolatopsis jiangsuensis]|uniref:Glucose/arabinose dehydrogenase/type 1 glutamine amidotransferase n=1 Tax=Amycolatopsis jiangsuensis TaxID=1181879 RepID=A0A840J6Q1_9PSEU|nr:ThuA domain-containing protein [Amycolatopsis jiangsuensis]MBB4689067.1 glucose/arabinose dehydrogenase/type 1 glutamine amidotransferase [Amycolatopsis jiangsuensis]
MRRRAFRFGLRRRSLSALAAGAVVGAGLPLVVTPAAEAATNVPINVLVFHGAAGDQKDPVLRATDAIASLGQANGITVTSSSDPAVFTPATLAKYRGVVFLSSQGTELDRDQETSLQNYMKDGGGFLGLSDAAKAQDGSQWFSGLIGARPVGSRPTPQAITASGENPPNETKEKLADNDPSTKWLSKEPTGWVAYQMSAPITVNSYTLVSGNDYAGRDPKDWTLQGSDDGTTWTDLDTRTGETFADRQQTRTFPVTGAKAYAHYRLNITANAGEPLLQLADFRLDTDQSTPPPEGDPAKATVDVLDKLNPATAGLPQKWVRTDRWLNWDVNPVGTVHTVAQVEEAGYTPGAGANGPFHPISWCRDYDGGRSFYSGMGRTEASYGEAEFRQHILGALKWTTGMVRGDCKAGIASNYKVERLTGKNQPGQLDQIGEPHGLTIAPDGKVFYIGKAACPTGPVVSWDDPNVGLGCGTIHQWDPVTKKPKLLTTLQVMGNRGSGDELVKNEEGLLGLTLDPKFSENGWMYAYWMPHDSIDRDKQVGRRTVSRFTYDLKNQTLDQATRKDLLSWEVQIHSCCHAGGGMDFDKDGNLYIGSGDNNSSEGSNGYSGNNWTADYKGISFQDARRTAGNTNNLAGKILRIHPEADGTYTIPEGNLFPEDKDPGDKTLPEIYVMGVRNISRLHIDKKTNWLHAAWVGPDASSPSPELGPAKYETATIITEAGNQGWPYCMGNKQPYRDRSSTDAAVLTGWYDCDNPVNTSPRNTGLVNLPPVKKNMIWYSPDGGGPVFPNRPGSSVPTYNAADATYTEPYLRGGGQAVMDGPTYHRDLVNANSGVAWPEYWNDKWFIGDESNGQNRIAATVDAEGVANQDPPLFAETLRQIIPSGGGDEKLQSWMDAKFGPDGALYVLDYGSGFFSLDSNQKLLKISYTGGGPTPAATVSSAMVQNKPLTAAFTGSKAGGVSYKWDFGDGTVSTQADPRHTYANTGLYTAKLTVTYADGETVTTRNSVNVGCFLADPSATVTLGDTDTGVQNRNAGGGCTVDDLIDDESTWTSHAGFVNQVDQAVGRLSDRGVLSDDEAGKITAAADASPIGTKGVTGYDAIYDGTAESFRNWTQAPSGQFAMQPDGSLKPSGGLGMLWYSARQYGDFSVKLQFKDVAPEGSANSGVFIRFPDLRTPLDQRPPGSCGTVGAARTDPAWAAIFCGHEIQIYDGATGEPQKTGSVYNFDSRTLDQAGVRPKGTWNDYEIKVVGQHFTMIRNGAVINEFDNTPGQTSSRAGDPPTDLRQFVSGYIGLQNHSDNDLMEFRNIRVRQL